jgi:putrescine transport system ATP-binding protein
LGGVSLYKIKTEDGSIMSASRANASRRADRAIVWGDEVWLSWTPDAGVVLTK